MRHDLSFFAGEWWEDSCAFLYLSHPHNTADKPVRDTSTDQFGTYQLLSS